jgi:hypothetical protein
MSLKQFTHQDNIKMLWDVISDEDIFTFLTPDIQQKIYQLFINNIHGFFDSEKPKMNSLVDLNKKYILVILNHIKKNYPYQPNKIKIYNEPPSKESITYEEIQNDRRAQFEKDFTKKQEEFEDYMTIKPPPVPEFSDKYSDRPIKEMDKILKEMQAQRNYEVEQINKIYDNTTQADNWLKPQETSLKNEKLGNTELLNNNQTNSRFKFLNELESNSSEISPKKNVSFSNNDEINTFFPEDDEDENIFSKLKKINNENQMKVEVSEINNEDRIVKLERNLQYLNEKMDKILDLLMKKNIN